MLMNVNHVFHCLTVHSNGKVMPVRHYHFNTHLPRSLFAGLWLGDGRFCEKAACSRLGQMGWPQHLPDSCALSPSAFFRAFLLPCSNALFRQVYRH